MQTLNQAPPLSLYIHLPWCIKKCPYCDFNSHEIAISGFDEQYYIDALIDDLDTHLHHIFGRKIISIFIGGGTPSLFTPESLDKLLSSISTRLDFNANIEITLEANPGSVEAKKFASYRKAGINRLSLGIQSFNNESLTLLGRVHNSSEAKKAIELCKKSGFENFNLDLMYGLPNQTVANALADLSQAIEQIPTHISWYQLTIEPNTVFGSNPPRLPNDDIIWSMQKEGQAFLRQNNYMQYEISAYAKNKFKSIHNINYWQFGDYLGIGAGAHSKITNIDLGKIERFSRHKHPKRYVELVGDESVITEEKVLKDEEIPLEFMMNTLRLTDGVPIDFFLERTGVPIENIENELLIAENKGLLSRQNNNLKPSPLGQRYLNDLLQVFMK